MKNEKPEVSVVIVNYRSERNLEKCVASLCRWSDIKKAEIIVVNNDSEESLAEIRKAGTRIKIINTPKNLGFGGANNLGVKNSEGEFIFFLNPDAKILKGRFRDIQEEFKKYDRLGIVGGRLFEKDGKIQAWSAGKKVTFLGILLNNLGFSRDKKIWKSFRKTEACWVAATALFIRRDFFEKIGGFDENIFMYFEDIDLCMRAREQGFKVLFYPRFQVLHLGGQSYGSKRQQKKHYYDSQEYYFKKHRPVWETFLIKGLRKILKK
jgi:GT2 family glycosyltransferase